MSRELRKVPKDWKHPKNTHGEFMRMFGHITYAEALKRWEEGEKNWDVAKDSFAVAYKDEKIKSLTWEQWDGPKPKEEEYMPDFPKGTATHFMMYETNSEGTPISPAFSTIEELAHWLVDNKKSYFADYEATFEQWLEICRQGGAEVCFTKGVNNEAIQ